MVKKVILITSCLLLNCSIALAGKVENIQQLPQTQNYAWWHYFGKEAAIILGMTIVAMLVAMSGLIAEVIGQGKLKLYLQLLLGISIIIILFGYFGTAMWDMSLMAYGDFKALAR